MDILNRPLFTIGDAEVTLSTLLVAALIVVAAYLASTLIRRALKRALIARGVDAQGGLESALRLGHYIIVVVALSTAFQTAGIKLSALLAAGAVFAVGVGLALQDVAKNFVSGIILLVERTIKRGDVVEVEGNVATVERMGLRATIVRTRDDVHIIVPNASLVQTIVKNLTMETKSFRLRVQVGVAYDSNLDAVRESLLEVGRAAPFRDEAHDAVVLLAGFGSSSIDYELSVWSSQPWNAPSHQSELREQIFRAFRARGIVIAFPQLDLHLDAPAPASAANQGP